MPLSKKVWEWYLKVPCSYCSAPEGKRCVLVSGALAGLGVEADMPHAQRNAAARRVQDAEQRLLNRNY